MFSINNYSKTPIEIDDSGFDVFIRHNTPQYFSEYNNDNMNKSQIVCIYSIF